MENVKEILEECYEIGRNVLHRGNVATYIPELAKADKYGLGISLKLRNGGSFSIGETDTRFTIQSVSKVVSLLMALDLFGEGRVFERVGAEPSGEAFNSMVELDIHRSRPYNPMINSGAITVASMLVGKVSFEEMLDYTRKLCKDDDIVLNETVYESEMANISRNRSIAYLLESKGMINADVEESLKLYTKMCSMDVTAESLSNLALLLAMDGREYDTDEQVINERAAEIVKTIMLTCGMYDGSGEFALYVGIPTKSGVGGGLLSVADNRAGIGIYGPSLDEKGNCVAARPILQVLSRKLKLHVFDQTSPVDDLEMVER